MYNGILIIVCVCNACMHIWIRQSNQGDLLLKKHGQDNIKDRGYKNLSE